MKDYSDLNNWIRRVSESEHDKLLDICARVYYPDKYREITLFSELRIYSFPDLCNVEVRTLDGRFSKSYPKVDFLNTLVDYRSTRTY